jgi:hypothetical protein
MAKRLHIGDVVICVDPPEATFGPKMAELCEVLDVDEEGFVRVDNGQAGTRRWARWRPRRFEAVGDVR